MDLSTEIIVKILSYLKPCPYIDSNGREYHTNQFHMIKRTYLTNVRGVCKRMTTLIQDFFPEEVFHLVLAKNSPSKVLDLFRSNPTFQEWFEGNMDECRGLLAAQQAGKNDVRNDGSDADEEDEEWDGDDLSDYMQSALDHCQESVVRGLTQWNAVSRRDVELHMAVLTGEPDEDNRIFLALKSRTLAFDFDDRTRGATLTCAHDIVTSPTSPHAEWLAARVLAFLRCRGAELRRLVPGRGADLDGWRLTAAPRDPAGRMSLQFAAGVSIG
jgi:hypothetical protein